MKKIIPLLLGLMAYSMSAQSMDNLNSLVTKLYDSNYNMDFPAIADLTYPKAVEMLGGKDKFVAKVDHDYLNEEVRMRLQLEKAQFKYSGFTKIGDASFCIVTFYNPTRYFYEKHYSASEGSQLAENLKVTTMATSVTVEPKRNSFNVRRNSKYVAISDATTGGQWKFFNLDDVQQREAFYSFFPDVRKQFGL